LCGVGDWFTLPIPADALCSLGFPRVPTSSHHGPAPQPPLIEPDMRFSLIRLSDGVHVTAVAGKP
jgi:hypothetical protein